MSDGKGRTKKLNTQDKEKKLLMESGSQLHDLLEWAVGSMGATPTAVAALRGRASGLVDGSRRLLGERLGRGFDAGLVADHGGGRG